MAILTKGISFPLELTSGKHTLIEGSSLIEASIRTIISWPYFTRWYVDTFGSKSEYVLEEPNDSILSNVVRRFIIDSITKWETRVELKSVEIYRNKPEALTIDMVYLIRETNMTNQLNYEIQTN